MPGLEHTWQLALQLAALATNQWADHKPIAVGRNQGCAEGQSAMRRCGLPLKPLGLFGAASFLWH
jgi:hypothetical protein